MRKAFAASIFILILLFVSAPVATGEEMAKEGSSTGTAYYVSTYPKDLSHEKERVQVIYEAIGIQVADDEASPFHHTSIQCVGAAQVVKGVSKEMGLCTATRPDGDKIYVSYEGTGKRGVGVKVTYKIVGGTGKCAGITGSGEADRKSLQRPTKDHGASISKHKYSWKIP